MARHPWVAAADNGIRWGTQLVLGGDGVTTLRERGQLVEQLGFDGCFIFDHPMMQADPFMCLAALSSVTSRVRLGSVVLCNSYRHTGYLARLAADLDNLSQGRLMLGLGIGWLKPEFAALDIPFTSAGARYQQLEETLAILPAVWGEEPATYEGQHVRVSELQITPAPKVRPPIMIGGSGEQRTLKLVAQYADACNISQEPDEDPTAGVRRKLNALRAHCEALGRPYDEILRTHFSMKLVIGKTDAEAEAKLERSLAQPTTSPGTRRAPRNAFVLGSPETVVAHYQKIVAAGIQYFVVQVDSSDTETMELLANEVAPRVG